MLAMKEWEIVNAYNNAEDRLKMPQILAELNGCEKEQIVSILAAAGCNLSPEYTNAEKAERKEKAKDRRAERVKKRYQQRRIDKQRQRAEQAEPR